MEQTIQISYAEQADVPEIMKIMTTASRLVEDLKWYSMDDEAYVRRHIDQEGFVLKALIDKKTAGFLLVRYPKDAKDNLGEYLNLTKQESLMVAHMESAAVLPEYTGRGIQRQLMSAGEDIVLRQGYRYLMGTAHPENRYSVNNFMKLGYKILLETEKYGGLPRYVFCKEMNGQ